MVWSLEFRVDFSFRFVRVSGFIDGFWIQGLGLRGSRGFCAPIKFSNGF